MAKLAFFFAGNVLFATGLIFHAFLYNFYLEALELSPEVMGHAAAALTAGSLVTLIPGGLLADRAGSRTTLLLGTLILTVGLALGAVAATPLTVSGAAVLAGAGSGLWRVAMAPVLMRLTTPETRARAFAWNIGLVVIWSGAGVWLAGASSAWLEASWGLGRLPALRIALLLGAAGSAASALLFRTLRFEEPAGEIPSSGPAFAPPPAALRELLILVVLVGVWMLGPALSSQFLNIFFSREHGLPIERIGFLFGVVSWGWALIVFGSGELARRFGVQRVLFASLLLFAPATLGLSLASSVELAVALYFFQGVAAPLTTPLIDQWLLGRTPPDRQGTVSSWRQLAADLSAMAGASLGGRILAQGAFDTLFLTASAIGLVGALGMIASGRALSSPPVPLSANAARGNSV
ncbi:MAG TPA: MFS transporter [Gemmatimonadales bacterium]